MQKEPSGVLTWQVFTSDGQRQEHKYPVEGLTPEQIMKQASEITKRMFAVLEGRKNTLLLSNPLTLYKGNHIVRIQFHAQTPQAVMQELERKSRTTGFRKTAKSQYRYYSSERNVEQGQFLSSLWFTWRV